MDHDWVIINEQSDIVHKEMNLALVYLHNDNDPLTCQQITCLPVEDPSFPQPVVAPVTTCLKRAENQK